MTALSRLTRVAYRKLFRVSLGANELVYWWGSVISIVWLTATGHWRLVLVGLALLYSVTLDWVARSLETACTGYGTRCGWPGLDA